MLKSLIYRGTLLLDRVLSCLPSIGRLRPLRGSFSAWEHLQKGDLVGGIIAEKQNPGPCPDGSVTDLARMEQHDHQPWPVFWVRSDQARLVGKMLHWRNSDERICSEGVFHMKHRRGLSEDRYLAQIIVSRPQHLPGAWTSLASNWADGRNYFHWILDGLTRLQMREKLPEETRILLPTRQPSYIAETIDMLGLSHMAQTSPSHCVRPERYYFCSPSSMSGVHNPIGFDWLREKFAQYRSPKPNGSPIFLTRRGGTRVPKDLDLIEKAFSNHGFEIINCGLLSVREQILKASMAPAIAGFHGAAMTNLLWATKGIRVLEIFPNNYLNSCYEQIALQGGLVYDFFIADNINNKSKIEAWIIKNKL